VLAVTDIVWVTVHANPNDETDLAEIEKFVIAPDYQDMGLDGTPAASLRSDMQVIENDGGVA
jgi:hypothetical protein